MRILPPALFYTCIVVMGALWFLLPGPVWVPAPFDWAGALPLLGGVVLTVTSSRHFHRRRTNIKTFDDPTSLVIDGAYRWTRNPMYLGFTVCILGLAILFGTATPFLPAVGFGLAAALWYVPFEEQAMCRTFGAAYDAYVRNVRRWL